MLYIHPMLPVTSVSTYNPPSYALQGSQAKGNTCVGDRSVLERVLGTRHACHVQLTSKIFASICTARCSSNYTGSWTCGQFSFDLLTILVLDAHSNFVIFRLICLFKKAVKIMRTVRMEAAGVRVM